MARARNIKPAFFSNDLLAEIDPVGRLLFIGLWTIADFKGDIEWREKKIKAQVLPYDNCDVKNIAINLDNLGFIRFYSDSDTTYINQDEDGTNRADSLILIPESLILNPLILTPQSSKPDYDMDIKDVFEYWAQVMCKSNRTSLTTSRKAKITARLKDGYPVHEIKQAIDNVAKDSFLVAGGHTDIEMICRSDTNLEKYRDAMKINQSNQLSQTTMQNIETFKNVELD